MSVRLNATQLNDVKLMEWLKSFPIGDINNSYKPSSINCVEISIDSGNKVNLSITYCTDTQ